MFLYLYTVCLFNCTVKAIQKSFIVCKINDDFIHADFISEIYGVFWGVLQEFCFLCDIFKMSSDSLMVCIFQSMFTFSCVYGPFY